MFQKTLKKKMRLNALTHHLGHPDEKSQCVLITCGDNNGAMNYYLRSLGGSWSWGDLEEKSLPEMTELLGDPVQHVSHHSLPFEDDTFDYVVSIDVLEHLEDPSPFMREMKRIASSGAKIIVTVPNGDEKKLATRIKNLVGMTKDKYGHVRDGYTLPGLRSLFLDHEIQPGDSSSFSGFFTEMLELSINFVYVNILSKKGEEPVSKGTIAPSTGKQLQSVNKTYRIYSILYPLFYWISKLDQLIPFTIGYVVVLEGRKGCARA